MKILIGCEFSGVVRDAFRLLGHDAWSCDLLPALDKSPFHIKCNVLKTASSGYWDMAVFHPPCTLLTKAAARWFKGRELEQAASIMFAEQLWEMPIPKIAIENPVGVLSTRSILGKPSQIIQPWMFGHGETKGTCLWLKGLSKLLSTNIVEGRIPRVHFEAPGIKNGLTRAQRRSVTYTGIAAAMAAQWGGKC